MKTITKQFPHFTQTNEQNYYALIDEILELNSSGRMVFNYYICKIFISTEDHSEFQSQFICKSIVQLKFHLSQKYNIIY